MPDSSGSKYWRCKLGALNLIDEDSRLGLTG